MLPQQSEPPQALVFLQKCHEEVQIWHLLQSTKANRERKKKNNERRYVYNIAKPKYIKVCGCGCACLGCEADHANHKGKMT